MPSVVLFHIGNLARFIASYIGRPLITMGRSFAVHTDFREVLVAYRTSFTANRQRAFRTLGPGRMDIGEHNNNHNEVESQARTRFQHAS
jgi:hypothetical protein